MESKTDAISPGFRNQGSFRPQLVAVIEIGTTSIRMAVAQINEDGAFQTLDELNQAVNIGKDTFANSAIDDATTEACVRVLHGFRRALEEYGIVQPDLIHAVATTAVREAGNRLAFLDRVFIGTGIRVHLIDEAEVHRLTYLGIDPLLAATPELNQSRAVVVEVGGGSTEVLVMQDSDVIGFQHYRLGSLRLRESLERYRTPTVNVRNVMKSQIVRTVDQIRREVASDDDEVRIIAMGGDLRFAGSFLLPKWDLNGLGKVSVKALKRLADKVLTMSDDQIVSEYHLTYDHAETLGPALLVFVELARALEARHIEIAPISLRDGLLREAAAKGTWTEKFSRQIIRSAVELGRKFSFNEEHARHSATLCDQMFDALQDEHQLEPRYKLMLHVAALLHDIGYIVSDRSHHKHSMYLIQNSHLFGLGQQDVLMVALIARYHRRAAPKPMHEGYSSLDWESRIAVVKLAAILRVAEALDRSESQRVNHIQCSREKGRLVISVPNVDDLSLEQHAMSQKGSLFEQVYGMQIQLRSM